MQAVDQIIVQLLIREAQRIDYMFDRTPRDQQRLVIIERELKNRGINWTTESKH